MRTLRPEVFLPPCHPTDEGPRIERDFQLMQCQAQDRGLQRHFAAEQGRSNQEAAK
jgi:hypothetical protein